MADCSPDKYKTLTPRSSKHPLNHRDLQLSFRIDTSKAYRYMTFASIIGHEQQKDILRRAIRSARIAHAYLFEGAQGIGKRLMALAFARAILCEKENGCGECPACRKVDNNLHPDVHILDTLDATIKIDQVRELQQQLTLRPLEGKYKFCLIENAEKFTTNAANALLKTLEEPQPNTVIILLSGQPEKLLTTIRSRCQRLPFRRLPKAQIEEVLDSRLELDHTQVAILAALSEGSLKKALGTKQEIYLEKRRELIQTLSGLSAGSNIPTLSFAEELSADKDHLEDYLDIFQAFFRDVMLLQYGRPNTDLVNLDMQELLHREAARHSTQSLQVKLNQLTKARHHLQRNVNRQLALEVMLLNIAAA